MPKRGSSSTAFSRLSRASSNLLFDAASSAVAKWRTTSSEVAERLVIANICADSDASSPSALRTRVIRRVDASRTWSLLVAVPCAVVITSPVTACVARTEIR